MKKVELVIQVESMLNQLGNKGWLTSRAASNLPLVELGADMILILRQKHTTGKSALYRLLDLEGGVSNLVHQGQ